MAWVILIVSGAFESMWAVALGKSAGFSRPWPTVVFTAALIADHHRIWFVPISILLPIRIQAALKMQEWLTRDSKHYTWFWLVPIKDLLNAAIWALAFVGNKIEWRGEKFRVSRGGQLGKV